MLSMTFFLGVYQEVCKSIFAYSRVAGPGITCYPYFLCHEGTATSVLVRSHISVQIIHQWQAIHPIFPICLNERQICLICGVLVLCPDHQIEWLLGWYKNFRSSIAAQKIALPDWACHKLAVASFLDPYMRTNRPRFAVNMSSTILLIGFVRHSWKVGLHAINKRHCIS